MLFWDEIPFDDIVFWIGTAAWLTGHASYFMLVYYAAAAQITFAADNRSTRLRVVMLVQHVLFIGWMAWVFIWLEKGDADILLLFMTLLGIHWWVMGGLMTGESPELSPRAKRKLPQSFLGRIFFTWFNPGPGTGYLFAISSLIGVFVVTTTGMAVAEAFGQFNSRWNANYTWPITVFGILGLSYITIYLGLGLLVVRLFRRFTYVGVLLTALTHVLLMMIGCGIPATVHLMSSQLRHLDYSLLQITSPLWTLTYIADRSSLPPETPLLLAVVPLTALIVFALNLPGVAAEVRHVRLAKPRRVADEDAELGAELAPPAPVRTSPWD